MIKLTSLRYMDRRTLLVGLAVVTVLLVAGSRGYDFYKTTQEQVVRDRQQLFLYQKQVTALPALQKRIKLLERQASKFQGLLFEAKSQDDVTSKMQIKLQAMITKAGMEPESLRPLRSRRQGSGSVQAITIKMRLAGTIAQFEEFLAAIYRSRQLFMIESFTVKPYKKEGLKVFIDVKGLYRLQGQEGVGSGSSTSNSGGRR